mmetsp:Transcript_8651/g.36062  ORF Transcript_8651/g.36062 Transcript_8651/m.36062 type:complete len:496 (+) Transcript_8651:126-1613(+)
MRQEVSEAGRRLHSLQLADGSDGAQGAAHELLVALLLLLHSVLLGLVGEGVLQRFHQLVQREDEGSADTGVGEVLQHDVADGLDVGRLVPKAAHEVLDELANVDVLDASLQQSVHALVGRLAILQSVVHLVCEGSHPHLANQLLLDESLLVHHGNKLPKQAQQQDGLVVHRVGESVQSGSPHAEVVILEEGEEGLDPWRHNGVHFAGTLRDGELERCDDRALLVGRLCLRHGEELVHHLRRLQRCEAAEALCNDVANRVLLCAGVLAEQLQHGRGMLGELGSLLLVARHARDDLAQRLEEEVLVLSSRDIVQQLREELREVPNGDAAEREGGGRLDLLRLAGQRLAHDLVDVGVLCQRPAAADLSEREQCQHLHLHVLVLRLVHQLGDRRRPAPLARVDDKHCHALRDTRVALLRQRWRRNHLVHSAEHVVESKPTRSQLHDLLQETKQRLEGQSLENLALQQAKDALECASFQRLGALHVGAEDRGDEQEGEVG